MNVLNTTISQFDAELKQLISEKITAELQSAIQTMVAETVPSIVGIKCNEFLNKSHTVLEPICETKYAHYISMCGQHFKCKPQPREQIVYYVSTLEQAHMNYLFETSYVIFKNGKILHSRHSHSTHQSNNRIYHRGPITCNKYDLTHEPSLLFITLLEWCWMLYYGKELTYQEKETNTKNSIVSRFWVSRGGGSTFVKMQGQEYITNIYYDHCANNADEMIVPLIELFTKEKPHELNLEVKNLLRLEDALNIHEVELHEREMDISLREMEMYNTIKMLKNDKQEYMHEKNKENEECKLAKKQIMEKFIAQERQIKQLNKQLEEITELYNVLIG
jgi:hypothetical protein